ncbi:MAG: GIY-YIG nuclease family protein [Candidatus Competibacteraceae bacterium]
MTAQEPDTRPGVYALLLKTAATTDPVPIGRRDWLTLATPGWAVYIGSALGQGGVRARLAHHRRPVIRPHWHIDYLRHHSQLEAVWFSYAPLRRECLWAAVLAEALGGIAPPFRFGASDCHCPTHLRLFRTSPALATFAAALRARCPEHGAVLMWRPE